VEGSLQFAKAKNRRVRITATLVWGSQLFLIVILGYVFYNLDFTLLSFDSKSRSHHDCSVKEADASCLAWHDAAAKLKG
jgi:hypothetical protein